MCALCTVKEKTTKDPDAMQIAINRPVRLHFEIVAFCGKIFRVNYVAMSIYSHPYTLKVYLSVSTYTH